MNGRLLDIVLLDVGNVFSLAENAESEYEILKVERDYPYGPLNVWVKGERTPIRFRSDDDKVWVTYQ